MLSQQVLLSLLQQLGCDLSREPVTKLSWIKDAAVALDPQVCSSACTPSEDLHSLHNPLLAQIASACRRCAVLRCQYAFLPIVGPRVTAAHEAYTGCAVCQHASICQVCRGRGREACDTQTGDARCEWHTCRAPPLTQRVPCVWPTGANSCEMSQPFGSSAVLFCQTAH